MISSPFEVRRWKHALLVLGCLTLGSHAFGDAPPNRNASAPARAQHTPHELTTVHPPNPHGRPYRTLFLAHEIGEGDIERYARWLHLSPEQRQHLHNLFHQYEADNRTLMAERLEALWDESAAVAARGPASFNPEAARRNSALYHLREDYARRMIAVERNLFDSLEAVLTESQQLQMERVRLLRERDHYEIPATELHGSTLELSVVLDELTRYIDDFFVTDWPSLLIELEAYDRKLTSLRRDLWQAWLRRMTRGVEFLAAHSMSADEALQRQLLAQRDVLVRRAANICAELAALNERSAVRLMQFLDEQSASIFHASYLAGAYPRVRPNFHNAREVIQSVAGDDRLDPEVSVAIRAMADRYLLEEEQINETMRRACREYAIWHERTLQTSPREEALLEQLAFGRSQRIALAEQVLADLQSLVAESQQEAFARSVAAYRERIKRLPSHVYDPATQEGRMIADPRASSTSRALRGAMQNRSSGH